MAELSGVSKTYLLELRQDERFNNLLDELKHEGIKAFNPRKDKQPPQGAWEYYSGEEFGNNAVLDILRGTNNE